jgi:hypothetical protein
MRTYTSASTQTDEDKEHPPSGGSSDKISWRAQQVVLPSSITAKKAETISKTQSVPSGLNRASDGTSSDGKPKTMITKTHPRNSSGTTGAWQVCVLTCSFLFFVAIYYPNPSLLTSYYSLFSLHCLLQSDQ